MTAGSTDAEIDAFTRAELSDGSEAGVSGAAVASPSQPLRLPKSCSVFTCNDPTNPFGGEQTFYIVGTAHVSRASCEDVKAVVRQVKPEVVFLELCSERRGMLTMTKEQAHQSPGELFQLWRSGRASLILVAFSWMLGQVGEALEVQPGEEFRVALLEAQKVGAKVVLGDRPVRVTLARSWAALGRWERVRFLWTLLRSGCFVPNEALRESVESMKDSDVLTEAMKEFGEHFPGLMRPLIQERDEYMVFMLRLLASRASRVVAVVGAGHLPGMRECWNADIDYAEIVSMPQERPRSRGRSGGTVTWRRLALISLSGVALTAVVVRWRARR